MHRLLGVGYDLFDLALGGLNVAFGFFDGGFGVAKRAFGVVGNLALHLLDARAELGHGI